jgi:DnaK suppressor protein
MFASIFQLMGFPLTKPVNSPPKEAMQNQPPKASDPAVSTKPSSITDGPEHKKPVRRQEVKTQSVKTKVVSQVAGSVVNPADAPAPAPLAAKVKPAAAVSVKPPASKVATVKAPVKKAESVPKAGSAPKVVAKVAASVPIKAVKPTAQVQVKDSVKTMTAKASKPEAPVAKPKVTHSVKAGTMASAAMPKPVVAEPAPATASSVPPRAGRPSSRLAQLTVPSMAQSVASTAAKASFMQTATAPIISPPLASSIKKDPKLANNWKLKPVDELTDAEVIAMPDDEYMNETQFAFFKLKLTKLKQEILSNAGETTEHLREETVVVPDPTDRATIEEEHALELRTRDRERKLLKKIEQSIQRIDDGEYGYCDETGEPIGVGRLLARPTANLSLEAQQRRELRQKMFGD